MALVVEGFVGNLWLIARMVATPQTRKRSMSHFDLNSQDGMHLFAQESLQFANLHNVYPSWRVRTSIVIQKLHSFYNSYYVRESNVSSCCKFYLKFNLITMNNFVTFTKN